MRKKIFTTLLTFVLLAPSLLLLSNMNVKADNSGCTSLSLSKACKTDAGFGGVCAYDLLTSSYYCKQTSNAAPGGGALNQGATTNTGSNSSVADINYKIPNPTKYNSLEELINAGTSIAKVIFILTFAGVILYGGFVRLTSAGDDKKVEQSVKIIVAGIVGFAIIVFAQPITEFIARLLGVQGGLFK